MKRFAAELTAFLQRQYPEIQDPGWYRFSTDLVLQDGATTLHAPMLSRLRDQDSPGFTIERE